MSNETERMLFQEIKESQSKYTYFLLAAAAASIAYALNHTQSVNLAWIQLPVGISVLLWAASFYYGCSHLALVSSTMYANYNLIRVQKGKHHEVGDHPLIIQAASEGIVEAIKKNYDSAHRFSRSQFRLLIAGALFYICWHVIRMGN